MWAFGVTLYAYLFGGPLPFIGVTSEEVYTKIVSQEIDWVNL